MAVLIKSLTLSVMYSAVYLLFLFNSFMKAAKSQHLFTYWYYSRSLQ